MVGIPDLDLGDKGSISDSPTNFVCDQISLLYLTAYLLLLSTTKSISFFLSFPELPFKINLRSLQEG